jgi:XTP/dITP diphosphohydrolase
MKKILFLLLLVISVILSLFTIGKIDKTLASEIKNYNYLIIGLDKDNNEKLLKVMQGEKNRKAKFVCSMVYYNPNGEIISSYGETQGLIMDKTMGENGFGYDVLFYSTEINKCFGVASKEEKNAVSHRFRALSSIKEKLL